MSGRLVNEVLEYAPESLSRLELLVLVSLAESARDTDRQTRGSSSSASVLAYRVRSSPGSVRNALATLQARALVKPLHARTRPGLAQQYHLAELSTFHRHL